MPHQDRVLVRADGLEMRQPEPRPRLAVVWKGLIDDVETERGQFAL